MRDTGLIVICTAGASVALWLLATGWSQPRPSLARSLRHLQRTGAIRRDNGPLMSRLGAALLGPPPGSAAASSGGSWTRQISRWRQPLHLVDRTVAGHVGILAATSALGLVTPAALLVLLNATDVVSVGMWVPAALAMLGAVVVPCAVHVEVMSRAADRRIDIRHQLSAYLDMVTMLLAGNVGHEGALEEAARGGDGLLFRELRRRMRESSTMGQSLVGALAAVGDDVGVVELEQVAATAALSAAEGAPVARTLAAKCSTLRSTLAAEQEAAARIRTDKVTPPLVGMAVLFMALIIYPALTLN